MPQIILDDPDGVLSMLRDSVTTLAERHSGADSLREKREAGADTDKSLWTAMAEAGWTSLLLPEDLGGAGLGLSEQVVLSEAFGRNLLCEPISAGAVVSSALLANAPTSAERDRLAQVVVEGGIVSPAYVDPAAHSRNTPVVAKKQGDGVVLDGLKRLVDAAASATDFLVAARNEDGTVLVSVPAGAKGLELTPHAGVDGATIYDLRFEAVHVEADRVLVRASSIEELLAEPLRVGRVALAAELAGLACKAVEITIGYTKDRVQFGKPIASFQAIQHRLVEMWSDAEFACAAVVNAIERQSDAASDEAKLSVLAAKARAGDAATSICRRAVHLHGAMGFTDECQIGLYLKRAIALNATLGHPEELRLEFVELERAA